MTMLGQLAELSPAGTGILLGYLLIRLLAPVLLIALAIRDATPTQRIGLVRDYLTSCTRRPQRRRRRADGGLAVRRATRFDGASRVNPTGRAAVELTQADTHPRAEGPPRPGHRKIRALLAAKRNPKP